MKYYTRNRIQIGDVQAFKQMLEDVINHKKVSSQSDEYRLTKKGLIHFSHNDKHYQCAKKIKIEATES